MNQHQTLTGPRLSALESDIKTRISLQARMAEHSRPVLEMEFGISPSTISAIEHDRGPKEAFRKIHFNTIWEVSQRRKIWRLTKEQIQDYTLQAISERHGVSTSTVINYVQAVKRGPRAVEPEILPRDVCPQVKWLTREWRRAA